MTERKDVVKHLESTVQRHIQHLTPIAVTIAVGYVNTTLMQHLHLYSYLVTDGQELDHTELTYTVCPSCDVPALREGVTEAEWEVRERVSKVIAKYDKIREEFESQKLENKEISKECMEKFHAQLLRSFPDGVAPDTESLQTAIDALLEGHAKLTENDLLQHIRDTELEANFKIEKTEALSPKKALSL